MAQYRITMTVRTENKAPRRGERESLRYRVLSLMNREGVSEQLGCESAAQATRRSVTVKRVV